MIFSSAYSEITTIINTHV